jgi:hypothetical protein
MTDLTIEDEQFLEDISKLPEHRKNGIIGYLKNKCDAHLIRGIEQGKKDALNGILVFMKHKSRLEIPTVQDNWIDTIRFIEKELAKK